ncbi:caspase family protein [Methyloglobulus sp.]|uniref:caspase family protein n=1 Tax=Methyloglobulus sp. TaxID=2518622 RepID=UPI0032B7227F
MFTKAGYKNHNFLSADLDLTNSGLKRAKFLSLYLLLFTLISLCSVNNAMATTGKKRFAFVVGNANYSGESWKRLDNPINDARGIAKKLEIFGYEVITGENLNSSQFEEKRDQFVSKLKANPDSVAFFYYSGHGVSNVNDKKNYLVPIDIKDTNNIETQANGLDKLIEIISGGHPRLTLAVIDACRGQDISSEIKNAMNEMKLPVNVTLSFASQFGTRSLDKINENDTNSPFAKALLEALDDRKLTDISQIFNKTRQLVKDRTRNFQIPTEINTLEKGNTSLSTIFPRIDAKTFPRYNASPEQLAHLEKAVKNGDAEAQFVMALRAMGSSQNGEKPFNDEAKYWLELAANNGHPEAQGLLGIAGVDVKNHNVNEKSVARIKQAAVNGDSYSQSFLGTLFLEGIGVPKDEIEAGKWLNLAADQGNVSAFFELGMMHKDCKGNFPRNVIKAVNLLRKASEKGHKMAQLMLGMTLLTEKEAPIDKVEASHWLKKSADQGESMAKDLLKEIETKSQSDFVRAAEANSAKQTHCKQTAPLQNDLKQMENQFNELSVTSRTKLETFIKQNCEQKFDLISKNASRNDKFAQMLLGGCYVYGAGVDQDDREAVNWFKKSAAQNHAGGQTSLGQMLAMGKGADKDDVEAANWYQKAADQGDAEGQLFLGLAYLNGKGVPHDEAQGFSWIKKASEQNHPLAQKALSRLYKLGRGVEQNDDEAEKWRLKAENSGFEDIDRIIGSD